jgi:hypothetical protein
MKKKLGLALGLTAAATTLWLTAPLPSSGVVGNIRPAPPPIATSARAKSVARPSGAPATTPATDPVPHVVLVSTPNGLVVVSQPGVSPRSKPQLRISCDEDSCSARVRHASMDEAKAMLERIANRSVRLEVVVNQRCQVQRETIPTREPLVAELEHQVR